MDRISRQVLNIISNPHSTDEQLISGIKALERMVVEDNRRMAAKQKASDAAALVPLTPEERMAELRRRASANLAKRYR